MAKTSDNRLKAKITRMLPLVAITAMLLSACGGNQAAAPTSTVGSAAATTAAGAGQGAATAGAGMGQGAATAGTGAATAVTGAGGAAATNIAGTMNGNLLTLEMAQQSNSGQDGKATLTDMGNGKVKVVLDLNNGTTEPQPAHVHKGSCANLDPNPLIPLNDVVNGKSETEIEVSMQTLTSGHAINVHKSAADLATYVSCADIQGMPGTMEGTPGAGMMGTPGVMGDGKSLTIDMAQQNNSNESGKTTFTDMGNGKVKVMIELNNGTTEPQPAHVHKGSCANLDPNPLIPLSDVVNGKSETEIEVSMATLTSGHAVNVHKSATDISTYVSCGDIKGMSDMMEGTPGMMEGTPTP